MKTPHYRFPPHTMTGLVVDGLLRRRRSFREDARACIRRLKPPLRVLGENYIPSDGPCVLTMNHYTRAGFHIWWAAMAISSLVSRPVHWVIAKEWTAPGKWYESLKSAVSRFAAQRIAQVYGFFSMPPMPPRPKDVAARAASVRAVLDYVRRAERPILGLAPEGGDQPDGELFMPPSGSGRFALLLAAAGLKFIPIGACEADGAFCLQFGPAYELSVTCGSSADEKDELAARFMMERIAILLPVHLRGEFIQVAQAGGDGAGSKGIS